MVDLEYLIGGFNLIPETMNFRGSDPYNAEHLFVVQAIDDRASIYVAKSRSHEGVAKRFNLKDNLVGGGSCYINKQKELVLNDYSGKYGAVPKEVAQEFVKLILPELEIFGIETRGVVVNPRETKMNPYWIERGFGS